MTGDIAQGDISQRLVVATFAERPDLLDKVFGPEIQSAVPEFMRHDPIGILYYGALRRYLDYGLVAVDPAEPNRPVARAFCVPFAFRDGTPGRDALRDRGWDGIIRWGHEDHLANRRPNAVSALEIMVAPRLQGRGVSRRMLMAMRDNARRLGFHDLYGPLRPTEKDKEPLTPFAEYTARRRAAVRRVGPHPCPRRRRDRQDRTLQHDGQRYDRQMARLDRVAVR